MMDSTNLTTRQDGKEPFVDIPESLNKALDEVRSASEVHSEVGAWAMSLRPLLEAAVAEITAATVTRPSRRGTGAINYLVERTEQGEVLTEDRAGGKSKPFRCPAKVYETLVVVLSEAARPLALDEIMTAVAARMGDRPPEHQVRVALRLWMHIEPPLATRNRTRYRPSSLTQFSRQAVEHWNRLR
jgi:hypothetical protein